MSLKKWMKTILASAVFCAVLATGSMAAQVTANHNTNVRVSAKTSSGVVTVFKKGSAPRTVLGTCGNWVQIKVNGKKGYVNTSHVTTLMDDENAKTTAGCVLRSDSSSKSTALQKVASGTSITLTGTSGKWYQVKVGTQTGYLPMSRVKSPFYSRVCSKASTLLGKRYVYGATGPNTFDCSGLTQYVYRACGKSIPRTSYEQYAACHKISKANLRPGMLVFFSGSGGGSRVGHVGIYIGDGKMIHAANPTRGVITSSLSESYYVAHYIGSGYFD